MAVFSRSLWILFLVILLNRTSQNVGLSSRPTSRSIAHHPRTGTWTASACLCVQREGFQNFVEKLLKSNTWDPPSQPYGKPKWMFIWLPIEWLDWCLEPTAGWRNCWANTKMTGHCPQVRPLNLKRRVHQCYSFKPSSQNTSCRKVKPCSTSPPKRTCCRKSPWCLSVWILSSLGFLRRRYDAENATDCAILHAWQFTRPNHNQNGQALQAGPSLFVSKTWLRKTDVQQKRFHWQDGFHKKLAYRKCRNCKTTVCPCSSSFCVKNWDRTHTHQSKPRYFSRIAYLMRFVIVSRFCLCLFWVCTVDCLLWGTLSGLFTVRDLEWIFLRWGTLDCLVWGILSRLFTVRDFELRCPSAKGAIIKGFSMRPWYIVFSW